jgi:hypothetical protein
MIEDRILLKSWAIPSRRGTNRVHALSQLKLFFQTTAFRKITHYGLVGAVGKLFGAHLDDTLAALVFTAKDALVDDNLASLQKIIPEGGLHQSSAKTASIRLPVTAFAYLG